MSENTKQDDKNPNDQNRNPENNEQETGREEKSEENATKLGGRDDSLRNLPTRSRSRINSLTLQRPMSVQEVQKLLEESPAENVLKHAGDYGLFQKILFLEMCPFASFLGLVYFVQFFITLTPHHWCKIPDLSTLSKYERRNIAIPMDGKEFSSCHMYDVDFKSTKVRPPPDTPKVQCKYGNEFDYHEVTYATITSELEWVCSKDNYPTIAQSVFFIGACAGGLISGWMADNYGRIPALMAVNLVGCIGGVASTFSKNLWQFSLFRFIAGMAFDNCFMMMFILALEYVGTNHRTFVANMAVAMYFGGTLVILPWVAKGIANWRTFVYVCTLPMLIVLIAPWTIPESAKWLITRGKQDKAKKIIGVVERINGTKVPEDVMKDFLDSTDETSSHESLLDMLRVPSMRAMLVMLLIVHGADAMVYDVIVRISEDLGMDVFLTFSLSSLTELPSNVIIAFLLDKQGRRKFAVIPMAVAGILLVVACLVPKGIPMVVLAMLARFLIILAFNTVTQWAFELLPTTVRASGSSCMHICGYLGNILAPSIVYSGRIWAPMPFLVTSLLAIAGAAICILLPETKDKSMPQTMMDSKLLFYTTVLGKYYFKSDHSAEIRRRSRT